MEDRHGHWIKFTIDAGMGITYRVECHEPEGARCRLARAEPEESSQTLADLLLGPAPAPEPATYDIGYCLAVDWFQDAIGGSGDDIGLYYDGPDGHALVDGPIEVQWLPGTDEGEYLWHYTEYCAVCGDRIEYLNPPPGDGTAAWWAHEHHPADHHDATPGAIESPDDTAESPDDEPCPECGAPIIMKASGVACSACPWWDCY